MAIKVLKTMRGSRNCIRALLFKAFEAFDGELDFLERELGVDTAISRLAAPSLNSLFCRSACLIGRSSAKGFPKLANASPAIKCLGIFRVLLPLAPSAATLLAPSAANPPAPSAATPLAPSAATPLAPSAANPLAPSVASPVAPSVASPVAPSAATPVVGFRVLRPRATVAVLGSSAPSPSLVDSGDVMFLIRAEWRSPMPKPSGILRLSLMRGEDSARLPWVGWSGEPF